MSSTFFGLEIARRSLQAHTRAMDITGHNIANASRLGYSRQRAVFTAGTPFPSVSMLRETGAFQLGTGVDISQIERVRDGYLDVQMRQALANLGQSEQETTVLGRLEAVFPEPSEFGIQKFIDDFFGSWYSLSQNPDNPPAEVVYGAGKALADSIRVAHGQVSAIRGELLNGDIPVGEPPAAISADSMVGQQLARINELGNQIAQLNHEIGRQMRLGNMPNDLMDQRDMLLDELAKFGPISVSPAGDGMGAVNVSIMGRQLVNGVEWDIETTDFGFDDIAMTAHYDADRKLTIDDMTIQGEGSLPALVGLVDTLDGYLRSLDNLAAPLRDQVNRYFNPNPAYNPTDPSSQPYLDSTSPDWVNFFTTTDPALTDAEGLTINGTKSDVIAQLQVLPPQEALNEGQLQPQVEGIYADLLSAIGSDLSAARNHLGLHNAVVQQVEGLRQSVMGVSLDEELTNMMQYQYAYQASAKVITIIDEMLDTLINRMR